MQADRDSIMKAKTGRGKTLLVPTQRRVGRALHVSFIKQRFMLAS